MCLLQRHAPPPLPSPCFPPGPSLLRHSARGDVGVGDSATRGGNATSERMALHEGEDLFSLQISIDPIGGLVQVEAHRGGGGVSLRCFLFVCLLLALLCCPPLPLPAPPMKGKAHPIALLCLLHQSTASAGSAVRFACELPVPASSINRK